MGSGVTGQAACHRASSPVSSTSPRLRVGCGQPVMQREVITLRDGYKTAWKAPALREELQRLKLSSLNLKVGWKQMQPPLKASASVYFGSELYFSLVYNICTIIFMSEGR